GANGAGPVIELEVREPGPGFGQMVMSVDEQGTASWHFAPAQEEAPASRSIGERRIATRIYRLPAPVPAAPPGPATRGLLGAAGQKFLKVLVFPLIEPGIGVVSESFANSWEQKHRPYRLRGFGPDDYGQDTASEVDWKRLSAGRALLMVHGTFSRAHTAF